jgi:hypothetical protein
MKKERIEFQKHTPKFLQQIYKETGISKDTDEHGYDINSKFKADDIEQVGSKDDDGAEDAAMKQLAIEEALSLSKEDDVSEDTKRRFSSLRQDNTKRKHNSNVNEVDSNSKQESKSKLKFTEKAKNTSTDDTKPPAKKKKQNKNLLSFE